MNRSPKTSPSFRLQAGFSLIEIVFVMAITAIVFGTAIYMVLSPRIEKEIREQHGEIENLVLRARAMSYSYQQPFVIEFREGQVSMMPLARPEEMAEEQDFPEEGQPSSLKSLDAMQWPVIFNVDPKYVLSVKRWNRNVFLEVDDRNVERWIHQPNSPCEPMAVQLVSREEQAYLSREYHPLTGKAVDLEMAIGNQ